MGYLWLGSLAVTFAALVAMGIGLLKQRKKVFKVAAHTFWLAT